MKATLDHVGIAVEGLEQALAFYRDALGLDVSLPHDVPTELLEATSPDSPIGRFVQRRGPGLHHITLRVDDLDAALAQLRTRGVRVLDETPRPGAHGSRVAFIHPSSAGGVLVELKQDD